MTRKSRWGIGIAIVLIAVVAYSALILMRSMGSWRATILLDKSTGHLAEIGWSDLIVMLRPGSGFYLEDLARSKNPFETISSPFRSEADISAGARLFVQQCSSCHGDAGTGGPGGPSLVDRNFRAGRSDWALYRTITTGLPGTPMIGRQLPRDDTWKLVSYLRQIIDVSAAKASGSPEQTPKTYDEVTRSELADAAQRPNEWLTYSGSYSGQRHSALTQIDRSNVARLSAAWIRQFANADERVETSPIVRGSTMFVTEPPNRVHALDAASGDILWTYARDLPSHLSLCCETVNRGVALLGKFVYVGTLDAHLVALDAGSGKVAWDVAVADHSSGYSITSAPLAIDDMIVVGVAGGEFAIRGFIDAYDAATGKRRWRFYTVPSAGEPGSETWPKESLARGGAPTWLTGSFDPVSRLLYWGVGNPSPDFIADDRSGDNLYSNSVVALDADTGKLRWYFQFTPHDTHDWDAAQIPVLVDLPVDNTQGKLLAWANRNAFYYLFDRETGKFLLGTPFAKQTWADGLDTNGHPRMRPGATPTREGAMVYPSVVGATSWWSPSYDPDLHVLYVPSLDRGGLFFRSDERSGDNGEILYSAGTGLPNEDFVTAVKALDVTTGQLRWQYTNPPRNTFVTPGGLVSTAGKLVFGGDNNLVFALDSETGKELWRFSAGGHITAAPITYQVNGHQYVAWAAGRSIIAFALAPERDVAATTQP